MKNSHMKKQVHADITEEPCNNLPIEVCHDAASESCDTLPKLVDRDEVKGGFDEAASVKFVVPKAKFSKGKKDLQKQKGEI